MNYEFIKYEKKNRIAYVTINRPEVLNALHIPADNEMYHAFCDFRDDPECWVAILTGTGDRAFCAGNDLKFQAAGLRQGQMRPPGGFGGITEDFECFKPIIGALNGYVLGGGFELALSCDILVAAPHARFGLPETFVGLNSWTALRRLPRQISLKQAMGIILTGRQIDAAEAYRIGLVNEIVPLPDLIKCAERWAGEILRGAPLSVRSSKEAVLKGLEVPLKEALRTDYPLSKAMRQSEDYIEGPKAFSEKRPPKWKGR
jgi:enoyl-CoA hydratase/carnithine racemase